jgi:CxxC motif-containing protein (DUF1111 family)
MFAAFAAAVSTTFAGTLALQPRMGQPVVDLTPQELARFDAGKVDFTHIFTDAEGRGPIFNQNACSTCHANPIGGSGTIFVTRFGQQTKDGFDPLESLGGSLLQAQAISETCAEVIPNLPDMVTTHRITNSTMGIGLVEAIHDNDLKYNELNPPPGISGKAHMVVPAETPGGAERVGRFGWKAQVATVLTFSGDASVNELGLTNQLFPTENAPNGDQVLLAQCDAVADPEDVPDGQGIRFIDRITDFQRFLAPPPQTPRSGMAGEPLFALVGCTNCHVPSFTTDTATTIEPPLRGRVIRPYSDFLLHDMGVGGDGIAQGQANEREIRTPSLWGLRVRDPLMHGGSIGGGTFSERILAAITAHDAEFAESRQSAQDFFNILTTQQQEQVIAFLDSLGRAEFDHTGDNVVNVNDLPIVTGCFGPGPYTPNDPCAISDIDQDGDVDLTDITYFQEAYEGLNRDCNGNSTPDLVDIITATSSDCNANGRPDECDPESYDIDLFVGQLLATTQNPTLVCMFDQDDDDVLTGLDIQAFVDALINP